jgi:hypothetical protein
MAGSLLSDIAQMNSGTACTIADGEARLKPQGLRRGPGAWHNLNQASSVEMLNVDPLNLSAAAHWLHSPKPAPSRQFSRQMDAMF